jgi:diacylglycerol kinase family enzyme
LAYALGCKHINTAIFYALKGYAVAADLIQVTLDDTQVLASCAIAWRVVSQIAEDATKLRSLGTAVRTMQRYAISGAMTLLAPLEDYRATLFLTDDEGMTEVVDGPFVLVMATNHPCPSSLSSEILAPLADIEDGLIDVQVIKEAGRVRLLQFLSKMRSGGQHVFESWLQYSKVKRLRIVSDRIMPINVDGEVYYSSYIEAQAQPRVARFTGVNEQISVIEPT